MAQEIVPEHKPNRYITRYKRSSSNLDMKEKKMKRHILTTVLKLKRGTSKTPRKKLQDYKPKKQNQ